MELPPRARRILMAITTMINANGTTSACAENTRYDTPRLDPDVNYLRVRGEYMLPLAAGWKRMELPPRARRIRSAPWWLIYVRGTTSACAENTISRALSKSSIRNYLRVRGEYPASVQGQKLKRELPPRARRIPHGWGGVNYLLGTTSACAENT